MINSMYYNAIDKYSKKIFKITGLDCGEPITPFYVLGESLEINLETWGLDRVRYYEEVKHFDDLTAYELQEINFLLEEVKEMKKNKVIKNARVASRDDLQDMRKWDLIQLAFDLRLIDDKNKCFKTYDDLVDLIVDSKIKCIVDL